MVYDNYCAVNLKMSISFIEILFLGHFTFKLLSRQDRSFGTIGTINGEHKILTSLTWLTAEVLVAGTSANQLLFVEGGDPKVTYEANKVNIIDLERAKES